jgi:hypothetical protein
VDNKLRLEKRRSGREKILLSSMMPLIRLLVACGSRKRLHVMLPQQEEQERLEATREWDRLELERLEAQGMGEAG